ncbi:CLUMA_CG018973, isoform A [Clunio marinus]|uniref:CLUMA_CG018973, isoform A n=1 Tax=Clunio marinus TaxID=568069 RepID=A0A1J1J1N6_9DIPT|nr:CLUMA_CG018973, isoform A [Clunio marinus]
MDFNRKAMIFSVSVLGLSLTIFLFAYMVFGDNTDEDLRTLRQVNMLLCYQLIFRHGAKYPDRAYRKDYLHQEIQASDPGSLSLSGSLQMYNLGELLRHRYIKLFPNNGFYSKKFIQVKSSWMDRTIASALSFLAGFMPPLQNTNPLPIPWQPVPVVSIARDRDDLIAQKRACARYDEVYKAQMNSEEIKAIDERSKNLYKILSKNTGENISSIRDVEFLQNTLEAEEAASWEIPDWTEDFYPSKTLPLAERYLRLLTETPFMKRIKGGPLITEIIETMVARKNQLSEKAISIYSGHDVTLVNVMNAMHILNQTSGKPDFAAALAIELHLSLDHKNDMDVKIYYYFNSEDKYPKSIKIPSCDSPCSLDRFRKVMNGLIVNDFEKLCETA